MSSYGASNVDVDINQTFFLKATAFVGMYMEKVQIYWQSGDIISIYVDIAGKDIDITSVDN
jgi:hypothetical protein